MVTSYIDDVWIHEADHPDTYVTARVGTIVKRPTRRTEVRHYAGGRRRIVNRPGVAEDVDVTFGAVPKAFADWIEDRLGDVLIYRDPRGKLMWGTVANMQVADVKGPRDRQLVDVQFTFITISRTAEV